MDIISYTVIIILLYYTAVPWRSELFKQFILRMTTPNLLNIIIISKIIILIFNYTQMKLVLY